MMTFITIYTAFSYERTGIMPQNKINEKHKKTETLIYQRFRSFLKLYDFNVWRRLRSPCHHGIKLNQGFINLHTILTMVLTLNVKFILYDLSNLIK